MFQHRMTSHPRPSIRYAVGTPVVAAAVLLGAVACGSEDEAEPGLSPAPSSSSTSQPVTPDGTPAATTSAAPTTPAGRTLTVTVTGNQVDPAPSTIDLAVGETLTLVVTSDHDDELHAHGFEVEEDLVAGVPASITLTGEAPGVYEVETHEPALRLLQVAVR